MEKIEITSSEILQIGGLKIIPFIEMRLRYSHNDNRFSFFGSKCPIAILIVTEQGNTAFNIDGKEMPLAELAEKTPHIHSILNSLSRTD